MKEGDPILGGPESTIGNTPVSPTGAPLSSTPVSSSIAPPTQPPAQSQTPSPSPSQPQPFSSSSLPPYQPDPPRDPNPQPTSHGTGDIILNGGNKSPKSKKPLLFAALAAIIATVIIVVVVLVVIPQPTNQNQSQPQPQTSSQQSNNSNPTAVKQSFNNYVNYVLLGTDSNNDIDESTINSATPYFQELSDDQKAEYFQKAQEKYALFSNAYYDNSGEMSIETLQTYFQDFLSITILTDEEIMDQYSIYGQNGAESLIAERYTMENVSPDLATFLANESALATAKVNIIMNAEAEGCNRESILNGSCYILSDAEAEETATLILDINDGIMKITLQARNTLTSLYDDIYHLNSNEGDSV